jgi:hypothetical protein
VKSRHSRASSAAALCVERSLGRGRITAACCRVAEVACAAAAYARPR